MSAIHREHPEATEAEIQLLQAAALLSHVRADLLSVAADARGAEGPRTERRCRDCGHPFTVPTDLVAKAPGSKWTSLCSACLIWET